MAKPKRQLILEGWIEYSTKIIPKNAERTQRIETKRAFYAGASHLFYAINSVLTEDREPTEEDLQNMQNIYEELEKWLERIKEGKE